MKSDYKASTERNGTDRFQSFPWRVPKVKSASRNKKCENNSRTENVCDVGVNKVLYVLFGLQTVFCPAFKMV